jgi:predicted nucleotidyltransferase
VIDWNRHCRRIIELLDECTGPFVKQLVAEGAIWPIAPLTAMLVSRHIPDTVRDALPGIPWLGLTRRRAYIARIDAETWPLSFDRKLMSDFRARVAPKLVPLVWQMKHMLESRQLDGNTRDGILETSLRGRQAHVTVRIPAARLAALRQFVADANAGELVPTVASIGKKLATISHELIKLRVIRIDVYGSVARAEATAASDIDLAYWTKSKASFAWWIELNELLEQTLGKVVDAHRYDGSGHGPPARAATVWTAST